MTPINQLMGQCEIGQQPVKPTPKRDFAASVVNFIFVELRAAFPAWRSCIKDQMDADGYKRTLIQAMQEMGVRKMAQVHRGLAMARQSTCDFLPSAGKFCGWCLDDGGWREAFERLIHREPARNRLEEIVFGECWFEVRRLSAEMAQARFRRAWLKWSAKADANALPAKAKQLAAPKPVLQAVDPTAMPEGILRTIALRGQSYQEQSGVGHE